MTTGAPASWPAPAHPAVAHRPYLAWRGVRIPSYPALVYVGLVVGLVVENRAARLAGLDGGAVFVATLALLVPALVGARLLFVATHWSVYRREPGRIWRRSEGGAALYGGIPPSLLLSVPLLTLLELPLAAFWDVATFPMLIGALFTRLGCLLHGCCAGRPTSGPLGLTLADADGVVLRRIPTQLIEVGCVGLMLVVAWPLWPRLPFDGALYLAALGAYGVVRFGLDFTRAERAGRVRLSVSHLALGLTAVACGLALLAGWPR